MIVTVTFKDPDGVFGCIRDAANESVDDVTGLDDNEGEALLESRQESIGKALSKWIRYGEYLTVVFDTDKGTATVKGQS